MFSLQLLQLRRCVQFSEHVHDEESDESEEEDGKLGHQRTLGRAVRELYMRLPDEDLFNRAVKAP